jgi:hypothetical protein
LKLALKSPGSLDMNRGYGKFGVVLVLTLLLSIPTYFAFTYYYSLSEADFLSKQLKWEPVDQIDLLTGGQEKSKTLAPVHFNHLLFLDSAICKFLPVTSYQTFCIILTSSILRC